jgi:hypothetical protein
MVNGIVQDVWRNIDEIRRNVAGLDTEKRTRIESCLDSIESGSDKILVALKETLEHSKKLETMAFDLRYEIEALSED